MANEGIKYLKFATRQNILAKTHVVALVTAVGDIRAEYISGTEDKQVTGDPPVEFWQYQFRILEEDLPPGYGFDAIDESIFVAPYIKAWDTGEDDCAICRCFKAAEVEIDTEPPYLLSVTDCSKDCDDEATTFCHTRLTPEDLAELLRPLLATDKCDGGGGYCKMQTYHRELFSDGSQLTDYLAEWFEVEGCASLQPQTAHVEVRCAGQVDTLVEILRNGVVIGDAILPGGHTKVSFNDFVGNLSNGDVVTIEIDPKEGEITGSGANLTPLGPFHLSMAALCCNDPCAC